MKDFFILLKVAWFCDFISAKSDVRLPPRIIREPSKSVIYRIDESVTLTCEAAGTPAVKYEWKKNGFDLPNHLPILSNDADGTITITTLTSRDEGFYQCFASNQYGTALSITTHIQRALLHSAAGTPTWPILHKTIQEGMPFHIQATPRKSFPQPSHEWMMVNDNEDRNSAQIQLSERIQIAENGDLYFAYALLEDDLGGRIYKCTTYNPYLDVKVGGSYTQLTVTRNPANISEFAPTLGFSSEVQTIALIGGDVALRCFFYGYPQPSISWSRPSYKLPNRRRTLTSFNTRLTIQGITASDEGEYVCAASNTKGRNTHTLRIRVEAPPKFKSKSDGPYNVNLTEGESHTFKCNPFAKPEATIVWLQNGQPIDTKNPPKRFMFSNDKKSLTIRDVCRDCTDRESLTDLMVIQCNASNVHGYAFASGYLNVLLKTKVEIKGPQNVSVDFLEEKHFVFRCHATSDPSTPPIVRWYNVDTFGRSLVRDEPPYIYVTKNLLIIMIYPNCSADCAKHLKEYTCVGFNGYSRGSRTTKLTFRPPTAESLIENEESWAMWKILLGAGGVGLFLLFIGVCFGFRWRRSFGEGNMRPKERRLPNPPSMYERVRYDSVDLPLEADGNSERLMTRACSMYEQIGYASVDQIREEMANRERACPKSPEVPECDGYESIDEPHKESKDRVRRMVAEDTTYDDKRHSIPMEEVTNRGNIDQHQVYGDESATSKSENIPLSNEQSESTYTNSDLSRKEVSPYLDLENSNASPKEEYPFWDMGSKETNLYMDMGPKKVSPILDQNPKEVNPYLDLVSEDVIPCMDMGPKEVNPYINMGTQEVNL